MRIVYTVEFQKRFHKLPKRTQAIFRKQEKIFATDWQDSRLHTKKLKQDKLTFSFRLTRQYRVLFVFIDPGQVLFVTVGHRKDIYR